MYAKAQVRNQEVNGTKPKVGKLSKYSYLYRETFIPSPSS
ncbi:hypothetical protein RintRC_6929 [Richelia intracellularis]|nr:hypothetical protein RintRC_6929 [Richelia intracellularis]